MKSPWFMLVAAVALPAAGVPDGDRHAVGFQAADELALSAGPGRGPHRSRRRVQRDQVDVRELARYHRPVSLDPRGRVVAEAIPEFELAPVGELIS